MEEEADSLASEDGPTEDLRLEWETDEQWSVRLKFLKKHWDTMPHERLICLSNCFVNMEFLGCSYGREIDDQVRELSHGLSADYHEKRKKVVEVTFVRGMEGNVGGSYIDTSDTAGRRKEFDDDFAAGISTTRTVIVDSQGTRTVAPAEADDELDSDPLLQAKRKNLTAVKAFVQTADNAGPIEKLNYACYKAKVAWAFQFDTAKEDGRQECWIVIDDVLIVRMCFISDDIATAKYAACAMAVEIFGRRDHEVRSGEFFRSKFGFLSNRDKRYGFRLPDEFLYFTFDEKIKAMRDFLWHEKAHWKTRGHVLLQEVSQREGLPLRFEQKRHQKWFQSLSIFLGPLFVHKCELNQEQSAQENVYKEKSCEDVINILMREYLRIYDDAQLGCICLITCDHPITNEALNDIIATQRSVEAGETHGPNSGWRKPSSTSVMPSRLSVYHLHEQKLARVKENLAKIPSTRTSADRLHIASVRAQAPLKFDFKENTGRVLIFGVLVGTATGDESKAVKETACANAIQGLADKSGRVKEVPAGSGQPTWIVGDDAADVVTLDDDGDSGFEVIDETEEASSPELEVVSPDRTSPPAPAPKRKQPSGCNSIASKRSRAGAKGAGHRSASKFSQEEIQLKTFRIQLSGLAPTMNAVQRMDTSSAKSKIPYECHTDDLMAQGKQKTPGFQSRLEMAGIIVGRGCDTSKKGAKHKAAIDATGRLMRTYLKITSGPDGPEVVSSNEPIDDAKALALLEKLQLLLVCGQNSK